MFRIASALCIVGSLSTAGCTGSSGSSSSTPTAPTPTTGSASCRTYATTSTTLTTTNAGSANSRSLNCSFNTSTNQLACTMVISSCGSVSFTDNYASRADFVDEVSVIPPRTLIQSQTSPANPCGFTNGTYSYDGQRRLLSFNFNGLTYSYSAWDASGRPTTGVVSAAGGSIGESWSYNDAARSATLVQSNAAGSTVTNYTYDTNGNPVTAIVTSGGTTSTSTTSISATAQVCK